MITYLLEYIRKYDEGVAVVIAGMLVLYPILLNRLKQQRNQIEKICKRTTNMYTKPETRDLIDVEISKKLTPYDIKHQEVIGKLDNLMSLVNKIMNKLFFKNGEDKNE